MKILLINNFHYIKGGSEAVYFNTKRILEEHGHSVINFSFTDNHNIPSPQQNFFVHRTTNKLKGCINYFFNVPAYRNLKKLLVEEKPDIAHIHLMWGGLSPSVLKALHEANIPVIHTAHDYRLICPAYTFIDRHGKECNKCLKGKYYNCGLNRCSKGNFINSWIMSAEMYFRNSFFNPLNYINGFIFVSHFSEKKHLEFNHGYINSNRMFLYNSTKDPGYPKLVNGFYFLYYGRLSYEKGLDTLINVFIKNPDIKLKIVGTGPLEQHLKSKTKKSNANNISFEGYKQGDELHNLIKESLSIIVPSEWYENNPMTIIESTSYGKPVIGARIGGIPEIIQDQKTGLIFDSGNESQLESCLRKMLLFSSEEYKEMCLNSYSFFKSNFSEDVYFEKLISFYNMIIRVH